MLNRRRGRGFTLIEMLIAMSIMTLLLLIGSPSISTWLETTRIRNVANSLNNGIQSARAEAIRRNGPISFFLVSTTSASEMDNNCTLSAASGSWVIAAESPAGHCADAPSSSVSPRIVVARPVGDAGGSVSVSAKKSDASTAHTLTFDAFGRIANASAAIASIDITGSGGTAQRYLRVRISETGQSRVCDPALTDANDPKSCL